MKTCSSCGAEKDDNQFYAGRVCKLCKRADTKRRYHAALSERRAYHRDYDAKRKRTYTVEQRERYRQNYNAKYPGRAKAWSVLRNALVLGKIQRQPCETCGAAAQAHHDDYARPLDVRWLCKRHHMEQHRKEA